MRRLGKDITLDFFAIMCEVTVFAVKTILVYTLIKSFTDMHHENAMEVAFLIAGVDFLTNQRAKQFHTVADFKEKLSVTSKGQTITRVVSRHKESG